MEDTARIVTGNRLDRLFIELGGGQVIYKVEIGHVKRNVCT